MSTYIVRGESLTCRYIGITTKGILGPIIVYTKK